MKLRKKLLAVTLTAVSVLSLCSMETYAETNEVKTSSPVCDSVEEYPDGGKKYTYYIEGVANHCYVPPTGFNPLTASDEELARYYFPPRPDAAEEESYAQWVDLMSNYKGTPEPELVVTVKPAEEQDNSILAYNGILARNNRSYGTRYSKFWSGYDSNLGKTSSLLYTQVQMDYVHPSINSAGKLYFNAIWTGLGGVNNEDLLVQAGTVNDGVHPNLPPNYASFEYLSDDRSETIGITRVDLGISPGDRIHVYVSFQKANDLFSYYIANNTTGQSANGTVKLSADKHYDGTTAEWVVERVQHTVNNERVPYNLGDYGTVTLTNCKATLNTSNTWLDLDSLSGLNKIIMTSDRTSSGTVLSEPGDISSSDTFTCTWKAMN